MKRIVYTGLLSIAVIFTACNKQQQHGEVNDYAGDVGDINKTSVEEAKEANKDKTTVKENCADMIVEAAYDNNVMLQLSKVASQRASQKEVKVFAQQLVGDHSKTENQLMELASKHSVTLATYTKEKDLNQLKKLEGQKGEDFDITYLDAVVKHHENALDRLEELKECEDADLKSFASDHLSTMQKHLDLSKVMSEAAKKKTNEAYTEDPAP